MGTRQRREREKVELRSRILDAARTLFVTQGYEAVSMRRIADAIEYSPTAIYVHFADKDALMRELCRQDFGALAGAFGELAAIADPVERVRRIGAVYVQFAVKYPNHYRLMFMTSLPAKELAPEDLARKGRPDQDAYAFLRAAVTEAIEQGRLRPGVKPDAELLAQTLWSGVHGVASIEITHHCDKWINLRDLEDRTRTMVDATCGFCFTDAPAAPRGKTPARRKDGSR